MCNVHPVASPNKILDPTLGKRNVNTTRPIVTMPPFFHPYTIDTSTPTSSESNTPALADCTDSIPIYKAIGINNACVIPRCFKCLDKNLNLDPSLLCGISMSGNNAPIAAGTILTNGNTCAPPISSPAVCPKANAVTAAVLHITWVLPVIYRIVLSYTLLHQVSSCLCKSSNNPANLVSPPILTPSSTLMSKAKPYIAAVLTFAIIIELIG